MSMKDVLEEKFRKELEAQEAEKKRREEAERAERERKLEEVKKEREKTERKEEMKRTIEEYDNLLKEGKKTFRQCDDFLKKENKIKSPATYKEDRKAFGVYDNTVKEWKEGLEKYDYGDNCIREKKEVLKKWKERFMEYDNFIKTGRRILKYQKMLIEKEINKKVQDEENYRKSRKRAIMCRLDSIGFVRDFNPIILRFESSNDFAEPKYIFDRESYEPKKEVEDNITNLYLYDNDYTEPMREYKWQYEPGERIRYAGFLIAVALDDEIRVFDDSFKIIKRFPARDPQFVTFSPNWNYIAYSSFIAGKSRYGGETISNRIIIGDLRTGCIVKTLRKNIPDDFSSERFDFDSTGQYAVYECCRRHKIENDRNIIVEDISKEKRGSKYYDDKGNEIKKIEQQNIVAKLFEKTGVTSISFIKNNNRFGYGEYIAYGTPENKVVVADIKTGKTIKAFSTKSGLEKLKPSIDKSSHSISCSSNGFFAYRHGDGIMIYAKDKNDNHYFNEGGINKFKFNDERDRIEESNYIAFLAENYGGLINETDRIKIGNVKTGKITNEFRLNTTENALFDFCHNHDPPLFAVYNKKDGDHFIDFYAYGENSSENSDSSLLKRLKINKEDFFEAYAKKGHANKRYYKKYDINVKAFAIGRKEIYEKKQELRCIGYLIHVPD